MGKSVVKELVKEIPDKMIHSSKVDVKKEEKTSPETIKLTETTKSKSSFKPFLVQVDIPKEPPKTAYEFEMYWNCFKSDPQKLFEYFKFIPPNKFHEIFKSSLDADMLSSIMSILERFFPDDVKLLFEVLQNLTLVNRFDMLIMFLDANEKRVLSNIFNKLMEEQDIQKDQIQVLRTKYGIK